MTTAARGEREQENRMRTMAGALVIAVVATWSLEGRAQLLPPPPMQPQPWNAPTLPPPPQPSATQQQLNASENASSFRRFELVYLNAEVGGAYVNIGRNFFVPGTPISESQGGVLLGVGAGLRFLFFTLGLRGRFAPLSAYTLIEVNVEAGLHLPVGAWDPYFNLHGGYARASMNSEPLPLLPSVSVSVPSPEGGDFGGSLGTDYYFSALFSLGIDATFDALFLHTAPTTVVVPPVPPFQIAGQSSTGIAFLGSLHAGLHFDL